MKFTSSWNILQSCADFREKRQFVPLYTNKYITLFHNFKNCQETGWFFNISSNATPNRTARASEYFMYLLYNCISEKSSLIF